MIVGPPIPWSIVPPGAVVLCPDGTPRRIQHIAHGFGLSLVYAERFPAFEVEPDSRTAIVTLDEHDATANLAAAGLDPEIITTEE